MKRLISKDATYVQQWEREGVMLCNEWVAWTMKLSILLIDMYDEVGMGGL
jgi:hypothetical protein